MNSRKEYHTPNFEVILLDDDDILLNSPIEGNGNGNGNEGEKDPWSGLNGFRSGDIFMR